MIDIILNCTKGQHYEIMKAIRPFVTLSNVEIARMAEVSPGLVSAVFAGVNTNTKILDIIFSNISEGWEDVLPDFVKLEKI